MDLELEHGRVSEIVHFIDFPKSSYHSVIYFSAALHDMIYLYLT